jgi:hypothetical protein
MDFTYHRSLAPMLWVFVAVATAELLIGHVLLSLWKPWLAYLLSALTLLGIVWFVLVIRSLKRLPVRVADGIVLMRAGRLKSIAIPADRIAGFRAGWTAADLKQPSVLNLALLAWPSVVIDVDPPIASGRRVIGAVAHKLDDPAAFTAAVQALGHGNG